MLDATMPDRRIYINSSHLSEQTLIWEKLVTGLATLTDAIQTLSSVYIKHTNAILGEHGSGLDVESALGKLADNPLFQSGGELQPATPPVAKSAVAESSTAAAGGKVERKKRLHDPNAPKRPLTPFFLFMQTARSVITKDFGENPAKGAISAEGTRRWQEMPPKDKIVSTFHLSNQVYSHLHIPALDQGLQRESPSLQRPHARLQERRPTGQGYGRRISYDLCRLTQYSCPGRNTR